MREILWNIFELTVNLFQSAIVIQTIRMVLGDKKKGIKSNVFYFMFILFLFLELSFVNSIVLFEGLGIFIPIIIIYIYALISLRGTFMQKLLWSIFIVLLIMIITTVVFNLEGYIIRELYLSLVSRKDMNRFVGVIIIQIVFFYLTRFIIRRREKNNSHLIKWKEWFVLLIVPMISIFTMTFVTLISINAEQEMNYMQQIFSVMSVLGIFATNFLVYGLYIKLQKEHEKQLKYEMLKQVLKSQKKNIEETKILDQSIRNIRHDLKQHIGVALMMLHEKKYTEVIKYMESYNDTVIDGISSKVYCNNDVVNYLINSKCKICSNRGIDTYVYMSNDIPNLLDLDLCVLLGNALDNAIEGNSELGKKEIYVELRVKDNFLLISVKNTIVYSVLGNNPKLVSMKKKSGQHGLGILSMKEIVKKYNGSIEFSEHNNLFCCDIFLDIPETIQARTD